MRDLLLFFWTLNDSSSVGKNLPNDVVDGPKAADPFISARKHPFFRADKRSAALPQDFHIRGGGRMQPHLAIHRGCDEQRGLCGKSNSRQRVISEAVSELGDDIRGRGSHEKQVGVVSKFDVTGVPADLFIKNASGYRMA